MKSKSFWQNKTPDFKGNTNAANLKPKNWEDSQPRVKKKNKIYLQS